MLDESELIRRSERKRRKVYDTLNVHMLTDHRYLLGYENTKSPKKKAARKRYSEEESDSQTEEVWLIFEYVLFILKLAPFCFSLAPFLAKTICTSKILTLR